MTIGVHSFEIPHEAVYPVRDMVIIRIPRPPKTIGDKVKFIVPEQSRDMAQHNVMYGLIEAVGPLAFTYKDENGLQRGAGKVGDWAVIRPFAGTMISGGKLMATYGYRYVSSFQDIIGVIPATAMPPVSAFCFDDNEEPAPSTPAQPGFSFNNSRDV